MAKRPKNWQVTPLEKLKQAQESKKGVPNPRKDGNPPVVELKFGDYYPEMQKEWEKIALGEEKLPIKSRQAGKPYGAQSFWDLTQVQKLMGESEKYKWQLPDGRLTDGINLIEPPDPVADWAEKWLRKEDNGLGTE